MPVNQFFLNSSPIQFGTDGWRGVLGFDFTLEKLISVATAAAQELAYRSDAGLNQQIIIGYDRRFLASDFAQSIAAAVRGCGIKPLISKTFVTTPACSSAVVRYKALGAVSYTHLRAHET